MKALSLVALILLFAGSLAFAFAAEEGVSHSALFIALIAAFLASDGDFWARGRRQRD